jgi:mediator of RNA polymerase II transcription subunit 23
VEAVEEAFSCFLVHKPEQENERLSMYQKKLCAVMTTLSADLQESAIRQYLTLTAVLTNRYKMKQLLTLLENLVNTNILQAR